MTSCKLSRKTITQCKSCPWRVDCVPETDIPGYSVALHKTLKKTIAEPANFRADATQKMACHYTPEGAEHACAGWLHHQLGVGNNISLRMAVMFGQTPMPVVDGLQHQTFEATLPAKKPMRRRRVKRSP